MIPSTFMALFLPAPLTDCTAEKWNLCWQFCLLNQFLWVRRSRSFGTQGLFMRPNIVGDDVRSLIIPRQIGDQRLLTSSPTASWIGPVRVQGILTRPKGREE